MSTERRRITGPRRVAAALAVAITTAAAVAPLTAGAGATRAASPASTGSAAGVALAAQAGVAADQSPFLCTTEFNGLGQPIVDNQEKRGTPVYPVDGGGAPDRTKDPLGWSERCQVDDVVEYRYRTTGGQTKVLAPGSVALPADIAMLQVDGLIGADQLDTGGASEIPYLIRYQRGKITVADRSGLEAAACECYRHIQTTFGSLLPAG